MPTNASPRMIFQTGRHAMYPYFPKWVKPGKMAVNTNKKSDKPDGLSLFLKSE